MPDTVEAFELRPLTDQDRGWVGDFLRQRWGDVVMVTRGKAHDLSRQPGFAAWQNGAVVGLLTYHIEGEACELTSLASQREGCGIGSALIQAARRAADSVGCTRLWLITTNDNLQGLRFYQKRGFRIAAVHAQAVDRVSRKMKPGIPTTGHDGIPIRDEIELEMALGSATGEAGIPGLLPDFPQRLARRVVYSCPWLTLYQDRVLLPDGRVLPDYHVVEFLHAVGVLVENERGELLFEQVYRYPTGRLEWEIPAGALEAGEDPLLAAEREVYEETGYETCDHRLVYTYYPNDGNSGQKYYLVHCKAGMQTGAVDRGEIKAFQWLGKERIAALIQSGELMDGLSLAGVLLPR
jgi:8-oxo-dGTP pyrophosphatase MutT (NUDIX family)/GNAT superfamily N-acetyltransferase